MGCDVGKIYDTSSDVRRRLGFNFKILPRVTRTSLWVIRMVTCGARLGIK